MEKLDCGYAVDIRDRYQDRDYGPYASFVLQLIHIIKGIAIHDDWSDMELH